MLVPLTGSLIVAWRQADQFDWLTDVLRERGQLRSARLTLAMVAGTAGLIPLTLFVGEHHPPAALVTTQLGGAVLTTVMAGLWLRRWPTRRQSRAAAIMGLCCVAAMSLVQPNAALAAQIGSAATITGAYIAFLHTTKLLAFNLAVALAVDVAATVRLAHDTDFVTAGGSFWLVLFLNLAIPISVRAMSRTIRRYATQSNRDPLTGLLNRRAFTDAVCNLLIDAPATDTHLIMLAVDLDNFKFINDTFGHAAGDRTLLVVAELLSRHAFSGTALSRAGGDEFLIAFTSPSADPSAFASQLHGAISDMSPKVTASIGTASTELAALPRRVSPAVIDDLVGAADVVMYAAKRTGGHCTRHNPSLAASWTLPDDMSERHQCSCAGGFD